MLSRAVLVSLAVLAVLVSIGRCDTTVNEGNRKQRSSSGGSVRSTTTGRPTDPATGVAIGSEQADDSVRGRSLFGGRGQAQTLSRIDERSPDGSYRYEYLTDNGIYRQETSQQIGFDRVVRGSYSYIGPDNNVYTVNYVADRNGYRAYGAHLPTQPAEIANIINQQQTAFGVVSSTTPSPVNFNVGGSTVQPIYQPNGPQFVTITNAGLGAPTTPSPFGGNAPFVTTTLAPPQSTAFGGFPFGSTGATPTLASLLPASLSPSGFGLSSTTPFPFGLGNRNPFAGIASAASSAFGFGGNGYQAANGNGIDITNTNTNVFTGSSTPANPLTVVESTTPSSFGNAGPTVLITPAPQSFVNGGAFPAQTTATFVNQNGQIDANAFANNYANNYANTNYNYANGGSSLFGATNANGFGPAQQQTFVAGGIIPSNNGLGFAYPYPTSNGFPLAGSNYYNNNNYNNAAQSPGLATFQQQFPFGQSQIQPQLPFVPQYNRDATVSSVQPLTASTTTAQADAAAAAGASATVGDRSLLTAADNSANVIASLQPSVFDRVVRRQQRG